MLCIAYQWVLGVLMLGHKPLGGYEKKSGRGRRTTGLSRFNERHEEETRGAKVMMNETVFKHVLFLIGVNVLELRRQHNDSTALEPFFAC
jgi:hypothetical protein